MNYLEGGALENDPIFSAVQLQGTATQDPLVPTAPTGQVPITTISGGNSGIGFSLVGPLATLVSPLTTKGDLYGRTNAAGTRVPVGADDARLVGDASQPTGLNYINPSTGWGAPSGVASRAAYAAYAGQTILGPTIAEVQAIDDELKLQSQVLVAILTDLRTQKLFKN